MAKASKWHRHEFLDRISVVGSLFDNSIYRHEAMDYAPPKLEKQVGKVSEQLAKLYQMAAEYRLGDKK